MSRHLLILATLLTLEISLCTCDIIVHDSHRRAVYEVDDYESVTGLQFPVTGIEGRLVEVIPDDACGRLRWSIPLNESYIALVRVRTRRHCSDATKLYHVIYAGFVAALFYQENDTTVAMATRTEFKEYKATSLPAAFIKAMDAHLLLESFPQTAGYTIRIYPNKRVIDHKTVIYILSCIIALGCIFLIIWTAVMVKFCYDRIKRRPQKLTLKSLKKIPIKLFQPGDPYDVCAICLEDYEEGEKLRLLPCSHAYHQECVDPWLLTKRCVCPLCKKKVIPGTGTESEEEENGEQSDDDRQLIQTENGHAHQRSRRYQDLTDSESSSSGDGCLDLRTYSSHADVHIHTVGSSLHASEPRPTSGAAGGNGTPGESYGSIDFLTCDMFPTLGGGSINDSTAALISIPCGSYSSSPLFPVSQQGSPPIMAGGDLLSLVVPVSQIQVPDLQMREDHYSVSDSGQQPPQGEQHSEDLMWEASSVHGQIV